MAGAGARQRQAYEAMLKADAGPFVTGVPVLFSPALLRNSRACLPRSSTLLSDVQSPRYADRTWA